MDFDNLAKQQIRSDLSGVDIKLAQIFTWTILDLPCLTTQLYV